MSQLTHGVKVPWEVPASQRVMLLDADGPLYSAALKGVTQCDGEQLQLLDDEEIYLDALSRLSTWEAWGGDVAEVFVCLSDRRSFRKDLLPTYKAQRRTGDRPITLDALRRNIAERCPYAVKLVKDLEADDVCGIAATSFQELGYETVIVSPDKDLLQIPGMVLTPRMAKNDVVFSEVTEPRAFRWHMYQTLIGDDVDNYKGCIGVGPAKAEKLLDDLEIGGWLPPTVWEAVVHAFTVRGQTEEDALTQARVARILRFEDWDQMTKEVRLWTPPC